MTRSLQLWPVLFALTLAVPARAEEYDALAAPEERPYRAGESVPAGYHLERGPRAGQVALGIVAVALGYGGAVAVGASDGFENKKGYLLIPVLGPALTILSRDYRNDGEAAPGFLIFGAVVDALVQAVGVGVLLREGLNPESRLIRDSSRLTSLRPYAGPGGLGLALSGTL